MKQFISTVVLLCVVASNTQANELIASGELKEKFAGALEGNWSIVKEGEQHFIVLDENFRAKSGPDVKLFLSAKKPKLVSGRDTPQHRHFVSVLESFEGGARYPIPGDINVAEMQSVIFLCELYSKLWGTGEI